MNASKLWAGGLATALVAALVALVGIVVFRGVFGIHVLAPEDEGTWGDASTVQLMLAAAVAALVATGLVHLLLISTPRALSFFGWIVGLATIVAAVAPFATDSDMDSMLATAAINAVIGIAILSLLSGVVSSAAERGTGGGRTTQW
ncbi:hypothetical protein EF847_14365 [Actinobacteria bacterium YIM 96077]|uniref:Uncharacterized protein n=1 Tax=Phytoactinopolyspora halophila TaxID=1981511 RepID=A0A329QAM5_9ACTN|nr:hypothetical protein EF847_14365 [Actinobacteria bacterium YIM 96077]RAW09374.1 hypothetical protein DPM12_21575 [Phytoactinopolyspora halophila]